MTSPPQEPAVYNPSGYPVDQYIDGNLTLRDPTSTGKYGILTVPTLRSSQFATVTPSGDITGATDAVAIQNALNTVGYVSLAANANYYLNAPLVMPYNGTLQGAGKGSTILNCVGTPGGTNNAFIYWHATALVGAGLPYAALNGGIIRDVTIDGTNAAANTAGLDWGDAWGMRIHDIRVQNFTASGCVGFWGISRYNWTEKANVQGVELINNATQGIIDGNQGSGHVSPSWEYCSFDFNVFVASGQQGIVIQGGAYLTGGKQFVIRGNVNAGSGTAGPLLTITGAAGSLYSKIGAGVNVIINVENNGSGTPPQTINFGNVNNTISNCYGSMEFGGNSWTQSNAVTGQLSFGGIIQHDATLANVNAAPQGWAQAAAPIGANPANPAGTISATEVMMGIGQLYTPQSSGNVLVIISGTASIATGVTTITVGARHFPGASPPANGVAVTGNRLNVLSDPILTPPAVNADVPFVFQSILALTPGQTSWFDLCLASGNASDQATVKHLNFTIIELN
jgi:hypothetical protein